MALHPCSSKKGCRSGYLDLVTASFTTIEIEVSIDIDTINIEVSVSMVIAHISNDVLDWVLPPFPGHAVGLKAVMEVGGGRTDNAISSLISDTQKQLYFSSIPIISLITVLHY